MKAGYMFTAMDVKNPLGLVLQHKFEELGIVRKQLADELDVSEAYISQFLSSEKKSVSFMTDCGDRLVNCLMEAQRTHLILLSDSERKNLKRYYNGVYEGMMLLSFYQTKGVRGEGGRAFFDRMVKFAKPGVYDMAMTLVGEAIVFGAQRQNNGTPASTSREGRMSWVTERERLRSLAGELRRLDAHPRCEEIFNARGAALMPNRYQAFIACLEGLHGLDELEAEGFEDGGVGA